MNRHDQMRLEYAGKFGPPVHEINRLMYEAHRQSVPVNAHFRIVDGLPVLEVSTFFPHETSQETVRG